jgi:hypothetical protein
MSPLFKKKIRFTSVDSFRLLTQAQQLCNEAKYDEAKIVISEGQQRFPDDEVWFMWGDHTRLRSKLL